MFKLCMDNKSFEMFLCSCSEESYNVTDYSMLDQLQVEQYDSEEPSSPLKNSTPILYSRQCSGSHLFTLTIHSNHVAEKVEMLLGAETL